MESFGIDASLCSSTIIVITITTAVLLLLKYWIVGGSCCSVARLDDKTVIITGANTGIGKETALEIARRGAHVILACRDAEKGETAAKDIRITTGNSHVKFVKLNLASFQSIRDFAEKILTSEPEIHILINNAGVAATPFKETEDGYEMQFGVNHLGHFLLTLLLLERITQSAPARIINLSSLAYRGGRIHFDDINMKKKYSPIPAYCQSKLANILFTRELAKYLQVSSRKSWCKGQAILKACPKPATRAHRHHHPPLQCKVHHWDDMVLLFVDIMSMDQSTVTEVEWNETRVLEMKHTAKEEVI